MAEDKIVENHAFSETGAPYQPTIGSALLARENNFDALRLLAALVVIFSHCYSLTGSAWDPIGGEFGLGYGGSLGVAVFFVISGLLISRAAEASPLGSYLVARFLRIIPALVLVTLFEAFVVGPIFYNGPRLWYLKYIATLHLRNMTVFLEDPWMAGVFQSNPFPFVNGSLWTLPIEALFYLLVPLLGVIRRWPVPVTCALWLIFSASDAACALGMVSADMQNTAVFPGVRLAGVSQMGGYFFAGRLIWQLRDALLFRPSLACLATAVLIASGGHVAGQIMLRLLLPYIIICASLSGGWGTRLKRRLGDFSYGAYLFAYPTTNSIVALGGRSLPPLAVFAIALPVTLVFAAISWHLVERPALRLKARVLSDTRTTSNAWSRLTSRKRPA